ncbi:MAG: glycosyl hydrolase 115 family protein [Rikenellaceae bacterium]
MKKLLSQLTLLALLTGCGNTNDSAKVTIVGDDTMQIYVSVDQPMPLHKAVRYLQNDIEMISGKRVEIVNSKESITGDAIIVGLSSDGLIQSGEERGLLPNNKSLEGQRERFLIKSVENLRGTNESSIVVAGSDPLGAAFGVLELSKRLGVSPLYWWCDSKPSPQKRLAINPIDTLSKEPSVRFRGIFLNDEEAMIKWSGYTSKDKSKGAISPETYERVFELMLRLKANTIWPSMMEAGSYFFEFKDEHGVPINPRNATDHGIYIGTSHCENMARNNYDEWYEWAEKNAKKYNINERLEFDYTVNPKAIEAYWRERLEESKEFNMIYTMGIRGVHDSPYQCRLLKNPTLENRVKFLQNIINLQRQMIKEVFGSEDGAKQIFVPYEETGELYNGESKDGKEHCAPLDLPEDIIIVVTEDNHGYMRQTPTEKELKRKGGNGFYYHLAYQGSPSPYDWLTTTPYSLIREQLSKSYDAGAREYWIVNVGDIKPAELGLSFFMTLANDMEAWKGRSPREFVNEQSQVLYGVGSNVARKITDLYTEFTQRAYSHRPDFMCSFQSADFEPRGQIQYYTPFDFGDEAQIAIERYRDMESRAEVLYKEIATEYHDTFWHLVYYPIRSARLMAEKTYYYHKNYFYAKQGRYASVNKYQQLSDIAAKKIKLDLHKYDTIQNGKWRGIVDPYGYYNITERVYDIAGIPEVLHFERVYSEEQQKGIGSVCEGQKTGAEKVALRFAKGEDNHRFIDVFNRELAPNSWKIEADVDWVKFSKGGGSLGIEERVWVSIDWDRAPADLSTAKVTVSDEHGYKKEYEVISENYNVELREKSYMEGCGYVTLEAEHYSRSSQGHDGAEWVKYDDYGYIGSSMFVKGGKKETQTKGVATLEYDIYFTTTGTFQGYLYRIPTLNEGKGRSAEIAVGVGDSEPMILSGVRAKGARVTTTLPNKNRDSRNWYNNVAAQMERIPFVITVDKVGYHTFKVYQRDSDIGFDRVVITTDKVNITAIDRSVTGAPISYNTFGVDCPQECSSQPSLSDETIVEKYPNPEPLLYAKFAFSKYGCPDNVWGFKAISKKNIYDPRKNQFGWSAQSVTNVKERHHESMRRVPHWKRDCNFGSKAATFCIKLVPGKYELNVYTGDYFNEFSQRPGWDLTMSLKANGKELMRDMLIKSDNPHTGCYEVAVGVDN